tara:strand:- start:2866 stop:3018 length:153 start_codon:yes stop_codon:yes gene_type:complete
MADKEKKKPETKESPKKETKYSYGIKSKKDLPSPGTTKYKMMVLSGEIKE